MSFEGVIRYRVEIAEPAVADIAEAAEFIAEDSPEQASAWIQKLAETIESLAEMPERFPLIAEATEFGRPYRAARLHSHRIIFRVEETVRTVFVVRVRHHARKPLNARSIDA